MYFIGVTTCESSIHRIFPRWAALAGLPHATLAGTDIAIGAPPESYRAAVRRVLDDPEGCGALVTTHKVPIFEHARDLFTEFDSDAERLGEVSCIVRRGDRLAGLAVDTLTSGLALRAVVGPGQFRGSALIFGAGGAGLALAVHLFREHELQEVVLTDVSPERLQLVRRLTAARCEPAAENDRVLESMPAGSLIVNATGLGKDRPGSPISPRAEFPRDAVAWDFNYRGELDFLRLAREQGLATHGGWEYFLHGWSQIMARVLGFELTPELFAQMREAANNK